MSAVDEGTAGPYHLLEHLGTGGQGEVFLARHTETGESVALKRIWLGRDPDRAADICRRAERKAEALQRLNDESIVGVRSWGRSEAGATARDPLGFIWIAYELIPGRATARDWMGSGAVVFPAVGLLLQSTARALHRIHGLGIYHLDVKPENLMLRGGRPERTVLIDFGSMRADWAASRTHSGLTFGTPGYTAPELLDSPGTADLSRADQWSLGRTILDVLAVAGGLAVPADYAVPPEQHICGLRPLLPSTCEAVGIAIARDPLHRYPNTLEFARDACRRLARDGYDPAQLSEERDEEQFQPWVPGWMQPMTRGLRELVAGARGRPSNAASESTALRKLGDHFTGEFQVPVIERSPGADEEHLSNGDRFQYPC